VFVALGIQRVFAHAPYFLLWPAPALKQCSTLSHKRHYFRKKKLFDTKYVFWLSVQLLNETFINLKTTTYYHNCVYVFIWNTRYSSKDFNEIRIFSKDFRKKIYWKSKFHENPSSVSQRYSIQSDRRTRQGMIEADSRLSSIWRKHLKTSKMYTVTYTG